MDLSIIIPAYNMQDYIAKCLRSVMHFPKKEQNGIDIECIVVNDGSKDETAKIVERYIEKDSRIKLLNKENGGVSDTRNKGMEVATGKYIMFLDADDYLTDDAWKYIIAATKKEKDFMVFSYLTLYENGKTVAQPLPYDGENRESEDFAEATRLMYASSEFNACWAKLFKRDIVRENHIVFRRDMKIGEDFLFVSEYFSRCKDCYMSKAPVLYYLQRGGSAMRSYTMEQRLGYTKILYEYNKEIVKNKKDVELSNNMNTYYLKVVTNLFFGYAKLYRGKELRDMYSDALKNSTVQEILNSVNKQNISVIKKLEYGMLNGGNLSLIKAYFDLKAYIGRNK